MQAAFALKGKSSHVGLKRTACQLDVAQKSQRLTRPAAKSALSLTLEKRNRSTFFDNHLQLLEVTDPNLVQAMIKSIEINHQFNPSKYSQKMVQQLYTNQQEHLKKYGDLYDPNIGAYVVTYYKPKWGRAQVKRGLGYYYIHYTSTYTVTTYTLHYTTL